MWVIIEELCFESYAGRVYITKDILCVGISFQGTLEARYRSIHVERLLPSIGITQFEFQTKGIGFGIIPIDMSRSEFVNTNIFEL
jgi:hypothetical protein